MKVLITMLALVLSVPVFAGNDEPNDKGEESNAAPRMEIVREVPTTPVRDQYKTSTCWSFAGISLLETELIRMGQSPVDLSEMFIVRQTYERKADRYVRMHGKTNFAPGGEANDVTDVVAEFGLLPESVYSGLKVDAENHVHTEMDKLLEQYVESLVTNTTEPLSPVWKEGFTEVLDAYLGDYPEMFEYHGDSFSPVSFAQYLGIDPANYVMITSFTHQPWYQPFILEVPDNWSWAYSYNLPLAEFEQVVDSALIKGYSMAWAADVTEEGFSFEHGMAVVPEICYAPRSERESKKWDKKEKDEKEKIIFDRRHPVQELVIDETVRQKAFDNFSTTDDHGMHIVGIARDNHGKSYYYVKNSWGDGNLYDGYLYVSKPYFRYKTISVMLHKDAIPADIRARLGI